MGYKRTGKIKVKIILLRSFLLLFGVVSTNHILYKVASWSTLHNLTNWNIKQELKYRRNIYFHIPQPLMTMTLKTMIAIQNWFDEEIILNNSIL